MKITTIQVSYTERRSENFQTAESAVTLTAEIEPGDDREQCYKMLRTEAYQKVKSTVTIAMNEIRDPGYRARQAAVAA